MQLTDVLEKKTKQTEPTILPHKHGHSSSTMKPHRFPTLQFLTALIPVLLLLLSPASANPWDYVIIGSGPAGLVLADRLSATGRATLLLEAGAPSTFASGGREAPQWLRASNEPLSRFDVPGFFSTFPAGHQCHDIPFPAGCVLGGGAAVNSGIWFLPAERDFAGCGWGGMEGALRRASERIPGTMAPGMDGKVWFGESFEVLGRMVRGLGWREVEANKEVECKQRCFARVPFSNIHGERGGPLGTYFLEARARRNFEVVFGARVERVVRTAGKVVGVELVKDGKREVVELAEGAKVILSAGVFGSAKILWQSGVGPRDQLEIVKAVKGSDMIDETEWIDLPVGCVFLTTPNIPSC
jgi:cellobiose dehydrogenase (acceptor)